MGTKWCVTGDNVDMTIGAPQQCVACLCVRGNIISSKYLLYRWILGVIILLVTIFSFSYYEIPLFNTAYNPQVRYANIPECCAIYWAFYISSWYLLASVIYILLLIPMQCVVKSKYYQKPSDIIAIDENDYKSQSTSERTIFKGNFKGVVMEMAFQIMRLMQLFAVASSSIYIVIYWAGINEIHSDSFKNVNNPSDLGDIFNSVPVSFFVLLLQNAIIPIIICIDFFTNGIWYKYKDSFIVFVTILCYFGVLFTHYLIQFTNEFGDPYIYYQINFNDNIIASLIMCIVWIIVVTAWSVLLTFIKRKLMLGWIEKNSGLMIIDNIHTDSETLSDAASPRDFV